MGSADACQLARREERELEIAEATNLRQELIEASREVSAAHNRVADAERMVHDKVEAAARRYMESSASFSKEIMAANRRASENERVAEARMSEKREAEQEAREAKLELSKLKVGDRNEPWVVPPKHYINT